MPSFGEGLRRERELRGIELRDVAEATKISVRFLQALESDRVDVLPGGLFQRAFVRQYALYLGLDPERTVAEYLFAFGGQAAAAPAVVASPSSARVRTAYVVALVLVAALALAAYLWPRGAASDRQAAATVTATPPPATLAPMPSLRVYPPPSGPPASADPAAATAAAGLVLDLQARQSCWVAVEADGVKIIDRVLAQGESQTLLARDKMVLSVGNAGGLSFKLNGRPGVPLGRDGEVRRNIEITRQSVPSLQQDGPVPPA
ncbi:MAG: helix-turn-helix domain-containing protein [Vicinamibacteria bacterium]